MSNADDLKDTVTTLTIFFKEHVAKQEQINKNMEKMLEVNTKFMERFDDKLDSYKKETDEKFDNKLEKYKEETEGKIQELHKDVENEIEKVSNKVDDINAIVIEIDRKPDSFKIEVNKLGLWFLKICLIGGAIVIAYYFITKGVKLF